jgi:hypothetical protein
MVLGQDATVLGVAYWYKGSGILVCIREGCVYWYVFRWLGPQRVPGLDHQSGLALCA